MSSTTPRRIARANSRCGCSSVRFPTGQTARNRTLKIRTRFRSRSIHDRCLPREEKCRRTPSGHANTRGRSGVPWTPDGGKGGGAACLTSPPASDDYTLNSPPSPPRPPLPPPDCVLSLYSMHSILRRFIKDQSNHRCEHLSVCNAQMPTRWTWIVFERASTL